MLPQCDTNRGTQNQATANCTFGEVKFEPLSLSPEQVSEVTAAMRPFRDFGVRLFLVNGNPDDEKFVYALGENISHGVPASASARKPRSI